MRACGECVRSKRIVLQIRCRLHFQPYSSSFDYRSYYQCMCRNYSNLQLRFSELRHFIYMDGTYQCYNCFWTGNIDHNVILCDCFHYKWNFEC